MFVVVKKIHSIKFYFWLYKNSFLKILFVLYSAKKHFTLIQKIDKTVPFSSCCSYKVHCFSGLKFFPSESLLSVSHSVIKDHLIVYKLKFAKFSEQLAKQQTIKEGFK